MDDTIFSMSKSKPIPLIDLFCGAGGMTLGFTSLAQGRFGSVWANDNNRLPEIVGASDNVSKLKPVMISETDAKYGTAWSREELTLALYLYCQIPFAQTKASNSEVIEFARVLQRTPSSVARKLGNFGAFDPLLAQRGITGLTHFSKADKVSGPNSISMGSACRGKPENIR